MIKILHILLILFILTMRNSKAVKTLLKKSPYGVSYTGAGLLTPFHLGASSYLREKGIVNDSTVLAGSSGGALSTVTTALSLSSTSTLDACTFIASECREKGTRLTLRLALDEMLRELLPSDSADLLNNRESSCYVAYAEIYPRFASCVISKFEDKTDLIDVLRASCNIPFYFNGNYPAVSVRKGAGVDGFFAFPFSRFGAPTTYAPHELIITPFQPKLVGLRPDPQPIDTIPPSLQKIDIISPSLLTPDDWLFSTTENIQLAVLPPSLSLVNSLKRKMSIHGTNGIDTLISEGIQCARTYNGLDDIELVNVYLYNCGILAADKWYTATTTHAPYYADV